MTPRVASAKLWVGFVTAALLGVCACAADAAAARSPPPFEAGPSPPAVLRIWGPRSMSAVIASWTVGFHKLHPEIAVEARLMGSDTAVPGLYSGLADIALLGRHDDVTDDNGFSRPKGYSFRRFELMNGSLDTEGESPALAVLVSRENPVSRLTLAQLAAVAGCGCESHAHPIVTWGQLGAGGAWAHKPVHLYLIDAAGGTGQYFLHVVMHDCRELDWDRVQDFQDIRRPDGASDPASAQSAAALTRDPYGIAVSTLRYAGDLKAVAVGVRASGPFVLPSQATIIAGTYPLARVTYALIDEPPGRPPASKVREFLRYALSAAGQADVTSAGGYLPLDRTSAAQQSRSLK